MVSIEERVQVATDKIVTAVDDMAPPGVDDMGVSVAPAVHEIIHDLVVEVLKVGKS